MLSAFMLSVVILSVMLGVLPLMSRMNKQKEKPLSK
jgi:hypothetical protein